jgi:hypothetical protein
VTRIGMQVSYLLPALQHMSGYTNAVQARAELAAYADSEAYAAADLRERRLVDQLLQMLQDMQASQQQQPAQPPEPLRVATQLGTAAPSIEGRRMALTW